MSLGVTFDAPGGSLSGTLHLLCDAGETRAAGCQRRLRFQTARGWLEVPDPWGRRSRFRDEAGETPLLLHLCPMCAPEDRTRLPGAVPFDPESVDWQAVIAAAIRLRNGREARISDPPVTAPAPGSVPLPVVLALLEPLEEFSGYLQAHRHTNVARRPHPDYCRLADEIDAAAKALRSSLP